MPDVDSNLNWNNSCIMVMSMGNFLSRSQGGSVVNALLATGLYKIRALTRNPNSDKAKALKAKGVDEVVKCDLSNKEDIKNALSGADIAWILIIGVNPGEEERQGKLIADAAKEVGFNWLIYSFLPDSTTESDGKYPAIINLSGKNRVEQYIRSLGIPNTTFCLSQLLLPKLRNFRTICR
ncbi:hypothetical protein RirG_050890 [Rhizophagus irregularis DAOM 197198w]|uniref:NmrA-like domain-containing protein n=1 Tax=Rhizophagus irregularis (strain DAOM 197198w) TaxID=1432141 RepID=A0A015N5J7_RHIIW|nr:hypothetical protein RirG_050890 [Rhizophagus irregularis DAOM 197198w]